tara:strand:- start:288 stop:470 length:183 start_codon:yes stop_codon:yes gene_type:complete
MISKKILLNQINNFPSLMSIEELIEKLRFIEKLQKRIQSSKENQVITDKEMDTELEKWFK